jgi:hypothetical protein
MTTLILMKKSLFHPLDFFYDFQFLQRSKLKYALIVLCLAFLTRVINLMFTGYSFSYLEPYDVSIFFEAVWIFLPWLTWAVANWAVSTIVEGEGKFIDILTSSAFFYVPYILILLPFTFVSNIMSLKELSLVLFINYFMQFWMIFILIVQVKVLHDFEMGKTVWITILTGIGMLLIWFICIMIFGLVSQSIQFIIDIFKELSYRS